MRTSGGTSGAPAANDGLGIGCHGWSPELLIQVTSAPVALITKSNSAAAKAADQRGRVFKQADFTICQFAAAHASRGKKRGFTNTCDFGRPFPPTLFAQLRKWDWQQRYFPESVSFSTNNSASRSRM